MTNGTAEGAGTSTAWLQERAEVLKALALFEQSLVTLSLELRGGLGQVLTEVQARTADMAALKIDYAQRMTQFDSVRLKTGELVTKQLSLEKNVERVDTVVNIVKWVGAAVGAALITLVIALITGQAQVVFR